MDKPSMKINREYLVLIVIFLVVLGLRMFFVFQSPGVDYDSYFVLRQAEFIKAHATPLYNDPLSYSGRIFLFPPLFYYLVAGLSFILSTALAAKMISAVLFSSLVIIVFLIAKHITKNKSASLLAALFSGFVPILYSGLNNISISSLGMVLIFLLSYCFLRLDDKGYPAACIILGALILLTDASIFIFLLAMASYFVFLILERQKPTGRELEVAVFLFFLSLWFSLLIYKKAFLVNSLAIFWQNIPASILSSYFSDINFVSILLAVGVIPLLFGVYAIYNVFFNTKNRAASLYVAFSIVSFILLWLRLVPVNTGLFFLSINLIILSAYTMKNIFVTLSKTKVQRTARIFTVGLVLLFMLTSASSFLSLIRPQQIAAQDLQALGWIRANTPQDSVIVGRVEEGFMINYISQRKDIADSNFLFISDAGERYSDISSLFTLKLKSEAVRLMNQYNANYIFLSESSQVQNNISALFYADPDCFRLVYDSGAKVYEFLGCKLA